jgi:hypothetical protein
MSGGYPKHPCVRLRTEQYRELRLHILERDGCQRFLRI